MKKTIMSAFVFLSVLSIAALGATSIITNMTPATEAGGFIGNSSHNYTFVGTWLSPVSWANLTGWNLNVLWSGKLGVNNLSAGGDGQVLKVSGTTVGWGTDISTAGGSGANVSTITCGGTDKISAINNATGEVTCSADAGGAAGGNTSAEMTAAINNSGSYNITSWYSLYVTNATERNAFTSTFNSTYDAKPSNTYNATYNAQLGHNTTNEIFVAVDNSTFHKFTQSINWANLSSWNLNSVWTGTLGWGNLSGYDLNKAWINKLGMGNLTLNLNQVWTNKLGFGNLTAFNLNQVWSGTLYGGNISSGSITNTQIASGTITAAQLASNLGLNWANLTNYNLNSVWTGSLYSGNISGWNLNQAWSNKLGWGNISNAKIQNSSYEAQLNHNTTNEIFAAVDNNTFHKFSQTLKWGNLSTWDLNSAWSNTLYAGNISSGSVGNAQMSTANYSSIVGIGTQTMNINMSNLNITNVNNLVFQNGGKISNG